MSESSWGQFIEIDDIQTCYNNRKLNCTNNSYFIYKRYSCIFDFFKNANIIIYKNCLYFIFTFIINLLNCKSS